MTDPEPVVVDLETEWERAEAEEMEAMLALWDREPVRSSPPGGSPLGPVLWHALLDGLYHVVVGRTEHISRLCVRVYGPDGSRAVSVYVHSLHPEGGYYQREVDFWLWRVDLALRQAAEAADEVSR